VIDARVFDSAQVVYNMLNPSAATELPPNYRPRIMGGCSIIPRRPASGSSASVCSPAAPEPIGSTISYVSIDGEKRLLKSLF
jgi:hypothetical protein